MGNPPQKCASLPEHRGIRGGGHSENTRYPRKTGALQQPPAKDRPLCWVAIQDGDDDPTLRLALEIHQSVRKVLHDDWRGNPSKESYIKAALLPLLGFDKSEVERIFLILTAQREY